MDQYTKPIRSLIEKLEAEKGNSAYSHGAITRLKDAAEHLDWHQNHLNNVAKAAAAEADKAKAAAAEADKAKAAAAVQK